MAAAYGVCLGLREDASDAGLERACDRLLAARPTAVNLAWALKEMQAAVRNRPRADRLDAAYARAAELAEADVATCEALGEHGAKLIAEHAARKGGRRVDVLTHCNAGWLAAVDWGTALAPVYRAHRSGIEVHVWVDETRPRNQGAIANRVGTEPARRAAHGHRRQRGRPSDAAWPRRSLSSSAPTARRRTGDVCNKIGTYLKALAARDNGVPFYAVLPSSTVDWTLTDGVAQIPIEQRAPQEVTQMTGRTVSGEVVCIDVAAPGTPAANYAFDVTPARLMTGIVTERGVCPADAAGLAALFPELAGA